MKGLSREEHEAFIDTLLKIKANLYAFDELAGPRPRPRQPMTDQTNKEGGNQGVVPAEEGRIAPTASGRSVGADAG